MHRPMFFPAMLAMCGTAAPVVAVAHPAAAFTEQAAAAQNDADEADLIALAAVLMPEEQIIPLFERAFEEELDQTLSGKNAAASPAEYHAFAMTSIMPRLREIARSGLPDLRNRAQDFLRDTFTASEIDDLLAFYRSPFAQRLLTAGFEAMRADPTIDPAVASQRAAASVMRNMTAADYRVLLAFGGSSAGQKLRQARHRMQQIGEEWASHMLAENEEAFATLLAEANAAYFSQGNASD